MNRGVNRLKSVFPRNSGTLSPIEALKVSAKLQRLGFSRQNSPCRAEKRLGAFGGYLLQRRISGSVGTHSVLSRLIFLDVLNLDSEGFFRHHKEEKDSSCREVKKFLDSYLECPCLIRGGLTDQRFRTARS
jgi:hypothetical protein